MNCILCGNEQDELCPKCGFCRSCHTSKTTHKLREDAI